MGRNWIFLGDSLTEGVGSRRISHVTELAQQLRDKGCPRCANVHEFRLRPIEAAADQQISFNVAGWMNAGGQHHPSDLWLWNLGCEGQTIDSDFAWLPLIGALRPERVLIFRGSLESIIRPATVRDNGWPWWVPGSWRNYAAMDPRCYFSTTWWRKAKQMSVDRLKQKARLRLLKAREGKPLMNAEVLAAHLASLVKQLRSLSTQVVVLGLLPVGEKCFPGSPDHFKFVTARLRAVAEVEGAEFLDWGALLVERQPHENLFYRDTFHPNAAGARALAEILQTRLC